MASDTLWLLIKGDKINRWRKTKPDSKDLKAGEVPAKLNISWDASELDTPTVERDVDISETLGNLKLSDLEVGSPTLTEEEVEMVRDKRRKEMAERLRDEGFTVEPPEGEDFELPEDDGL